MHTFCQTVKTQMKCHNMWDLKSVCSIQSFRDSSTLTCDTLIMYNEPKVYCKNRFHSSNSCSHITDVHLLFCAHLINIFTFFTGVELRHFFHLKCEGGVWLMCNLTNSNSFHSFIFNLCIMIVHTLKMCTFYFVIFFPFFGVLNETFFSVKC